MPPPNALCLGTPALCFKAHNQHLILTASSLSHNQTKPNQTEPNHQEEEMNMAKHGSQNYEQLQEEEYIDMDLSSPSTPKTTTFFRYTMPSPPRSREFEFHMSAPLERETLASPADELFYKGKLLPLHLPPRLRMVEKLLDSADLAFADGGLARAGADKGIGAASTAPATPFESCNASPAASCYVSGELNAEDYFHECSAGLVPTTADAAEKKTWSKKLKFIRPFNLGLKLKASKAYLKTIFAHKAGNSDDKNDVPGRTKECSSGHLRAWRKNPFGQIRSNRCIASRGTSATGGKTKDEDCGHRRSFSSVIIRYSSNKSSSASSSSSSSSSSCSSSNSSSFSIPSSNECNAAPALRRSSSANSEMENPIQGAIAYCKKSQQLASVRKSASDAGFRFMSASKVVAADSQDQDETGICRG